MYLAARRAERLRGPCSPSAAARSIRFCALSPTQPPSQPPTQLPPTPTPTSRGRDVCHPQDRLFPSIDWSEGKGVGGGAEGGWVVLDGELFGPSHLLPPLRSSFVLFFFCFDWLNCANFWVFFLHTRVSFVEKATTSKTISRSRTLRPAPPNRNFRDLFLGNQNKTFPACFVLVDWRS